MLIRRPIVLENIYIKKSDVDMLTSVFKGLNFGVYVLLTYVDM